MKKSTCLLILLTTALVYWSCSKGGSDTGGPNDGIDCSGISKGFAADVTPIIQTFCNVPNCHNAGSLNGVGPLTNYTEIFNARGQIRSAVLSGRMPQNTSLSATRKNTIICWIDSGAPNN